MSRTTGSTPDSDSSGRQGPPAGSDAMSGDRPARVRRMPKLGMWAWSFVGIVVAAAIVVLALAAVSEIVIPLTFAAVLAVIFEPTARFLERHRFKPALAAGVVVLGLLLVVAGVGVATVRGVTEQADQISAVTDKALNNAADQLDALGISQAALDHARAATQDASPTITTGLLTHILSGIGSLIGLVSGIILGALIMFYLLKDGTRLRRSLLGAIDDPSLGKEFDDFITDTSKVLRDYGRGRTVMSAIVAIVIGLASLILGLPLVFTIMVVNFIGGYIPYIGAFLGGGLAVIIALGDGGLPDAVIMLAVVLAANLLLENLVEPKVMGRTLDVHPMIVLIVTALGGMIGGIIGLMLAVPFYVIARDAISRLRSRGFFRTVADRAQPTVQRMLD